MKKVLPLIFCCFLFFNCSKKDEKPQLAIEPQSEEKNIETKSIEQNAQNFEIENVEQVINIPSLEEEIIEEEEIDPLEFVMEKKFVESLNISVTIPEYSKYKSEKSKIKFSTTCSTFADEFFEHGNIYLFGEEFIEQYAKDNNHIIRNNIIPLVEKSEKNILYVHTVLNDTHIIPLKKYYNDEIIGEERFTFTPYDLEYNLSIILDGYFCLLTCETYYFDPEQITTKYPHLFTKDETKNTWSFKSQESIQEFYKLLFEENDEDLPEILFHFRTTVQSINDSLYIPQFDPKYINKLIDAGFSTNGEYYFVGGHAPEYMFIWTKELINDIYDYKLYLFEEDNLVGYYKDIDYPPFFIFTNIWFNYYDEKKSDMTRLGGVKVPESFEIKDKSYPLIRM